MWYDKDYCEPRTGVVYSTWMLKCDRHENCMRKRRAGKMNTRVYGAVEPLAFLDSWRDVPDSAEPGWVHNTCEVPAEGVFERMADPAKVAAHSATLVVWDPQTD